MSRVYVTNIGTPNERERKVYKTPTQAKNWCRSKLADHKHWCDAFNRTLGEEVAGVSKEIDQLNLLTLPRNQHREWSMRDEYSGFTFVVELWVEEEK